MKEKILSIASDLREGHITSNEAENLLLFLFGVSKRKFAVEWMRNYNYGIGSGTEYFNAESKEDALKLFWEGKNKEAFEVSTVYVC